MMDFNKKISKKGGVSIPAALRRAYGIEGGEKVNIRVTAGGEIILKRTVGACVFCGESDDLKVLNGRQVCVVCRAKLGNL